MIKLPFTEQDAETIAAYVVHAISKSDEPNRLDAKWYQGIVGEEVAFFLDEVMPDKYGVTVEQLDPSGDSGIDAMLMALVFPIVAEQITTAQAEGQL
jgi:hypothetical protein